MHGGLKAASGGVTLGSMSTCHAGPALIKGIVWESSASLTTVMSPVFGKQLIYCRLFQEGQNTPANEKNTIPNWVLLLNTQLFCRIEAFFYSGLHQ